MSRKRVRQQNKAKIYPEVLFGLLLLVWTYLFQNENSTPMVAYGAAITLISARAVLHAVGKAYRRHRFLSSAWSAINTMDGVEFENFCIEHFKKLGYSASPTATTGDYGADIILKKNGTKTVVQCKRYKGKVGVSAVQEAIGAKGYYKADRAMVVTNSYFTPNAVELARANGVELWDKSKIVKTFKIK